MLIKCLLTSNTTKLFYRIIVLCWDNIRLLSSSLLVPVQDYMQKAYSFSIAYSRTEAAINMLSGVLVFGGHSDVHITSVR